MAHRLYFDEDSLAEAVVEPIRATGAVCLTAASGTRLGSSDVDQLTFAAVRGLVIYTANRRDLSRTHTQWMESGKHHSGDHPLGS